MLGAIKIEKVFISRSPFNDFSIHIKTSVGIFSWRFDKTIESKNVIYFIRNGFISGAISKKFFSEDEYKKIHAIQCPNYVEGKCNLESTCTTFPPCTYPNCAFYGRKKKEVVH